MTKHPCQNRNIKVLLSVMKTIETKPNAQLAWHHFDAKGKRLGRLATEVAKILQGKHKPEYSRYLANGDAVIITNCAEVICTSKDKRYHWHTGYPGGIKTMTYEKMQEKHPTRVVMNAVKKMLPKGPLGSVMLKRLRVYAGHDHPHSAQLNGTENE